MTAMLTSNEARALNDIIVEELAEFGLSKAFVDKTAAAKEITPRVARRFDSSQTEKGIILLYDPASLEKVVLTKIGEIEARCV